MQENVSKVWWAKIFLVFRILSQTPLIAKVGLCLSTVGLAHSLHLARITPIEQRNLMPYRSKQMITSIIRTVGFSFLLTGNTLFLIRRAKHSEQGKKCP
jgi:hypothetical protein